MQRIYLFLFLLFASVSYADYDQGLRLSDGEQYLNMKLPRPYNYYINVSPVDHVYPLLRRLPAAATLDGIECSTDGNTVSAQMNLDLKYADNLKGFANAVVVQNMSFSSDVYSKTSGFTHAGLPANKDLYILFQTSGDINQQFVICKFAFHYNS